MNGVEKIYKSSSDPQLLEDLEYWKEKLRLTDWDIAVFIAPYTDMGRDGNQGDIKFNFISKEGRINLLRHEDWLDTDPFIHNMERVLIHELLHIPFVAFEPKGTDDDDEDKEPLELQMWHQAINDLSWSLYNTKYEKKEVYSRDRALP